MKRSKRIKDKQVYVKSHFLDSGAFSLLSKAKKYQEEHGGSKWAYYDTDEFWEYADKYASFIKRYKRGIDLYANLDAIPNPELTWRNQKYLEEKHGLKPVPVVHYGTSLDWLKKYIDAGYELIGLGGLVGNTVMMNCKVWIDRCFNFVCDNPERLPSVKLHGFGVTSWHLLTRYPWWSVDSAAWDKAASYGGIYVPKKTGGQWDFIGKPPYVMKVSMESPTKKDRGHVFSISKMEEKIIREWVDFIKVPFGKWDGDERIEEGIVTFHVYRRIANLYYFQMLADSLPEWPWPFNKTRRATLI
jgi:hypothetical protein